MTSLRSASYLCSISLLCGAFFGGGLGGCEEPATVGECGETPRAEDGLYACGDALVRKEEPPAVCADENPGHPDSCARDSACGGTTLCYCGPLGVDESGNVQLDDSVAVTAAGGRCVQASCRTSSDCGEGLSCVALERKGCGGTTVTFACTTDADACVGADCPGQCRPDVDGSLICETEDCG